MPVPRLTMAEFCEIVRQVLDDLPAQLKPYLENVVVDVERVPSRRLLRRLGISGSGTTLLGLFEGPTQGDCAILGNLV